MRSRITWIPVTILLFMLIPFSACSSNLTTSTPSEASHSESTTPLTTEENSTTTPEESSSSTEKPESTTMTLESTTNIEETTGSEGVKEISRWVMVKEILSGYRDEPSQKFFKPHLDFVELTSKGGELHFNMEPVVDPNCTQRYIVGWEFDTDIQTVYEGQIIKVNVYNNLPLKECYKQAKTSMAYGGELVIQLLPSGYSHFFYEEAYKRFQEGYSQYLFTLTEQTGMVGPPGSMEPSASASGEILVKNGVYNVGDFDALYGNFSFSISAGGVFYYTVTYLYEAVSD